VSFPYGPILASANVATPSPSTSACGDNWPRRRWGGCPMRSRFNQQQQTQTSSVDPSTESTTIPVETTSNETEPWKGCGGWRRRQQQVGSGFCQGRWNNKRFSTRFVQDVTIPDGTVLLPGQTFHKVWQLSNDGTTTWPANSSLIFIRGERMTENDVESVFLNREVAPGESLEIAVDMKAPMQPGRYVSCWRLNSSTLGFHFGNRVWADIIVSAQVPASTDETIISVDETEKLVESNQVIEKKDENENVSIPLIPLIPLVPEASPLPEPVIPSSLPVVVEEPQLSEFAEKLRTMAVMGFTDEELNKEILLRKNGDVVRAVEELLSL